MDWENCQPALGSKTDPLSPADLEAGLLDSHWLCSLHPEGGSIALASEALSCLRRGYPTTPLPMWVVLVGWGMRCRVQCLWMRAFLLDMA